MTDVVTVPATRQEVFLIWGQYGAASGARTFPRGRIWLLTDRNHDDNSPITVTLAWNDPVTGRVAYEDLGPIAQARVRTTSKSAEVWLADGSVLTFLAAPCVCGAGAV